MKGTTLLLLGGGAVAIGVGVLYLRRKQAEQKQDGGGGWCVAAGIAAGLSPAAAEQGCDVVGGLVDKLIPEPVGNRNRELNGECEVYLDKELAGRLGGRPSELCARYKNGCEPVQGAPGWSKCVDGTGAGFPQAVYAAWARGGGWSRWMTGSGRGDPTTQVKGESPYNPGSGSPESCTDPVTGKPGKRGWQKGKPKCCTTPGCSLETPRDDGKTGAGGDIDKDDPDRDNTRVVADRRGGSVNTKTGMTLVL